MGKTESSFLVMAFIQPPTKRWQGKRKSVFAIVVDNRVISVLLIMQPITLGIGQINGRFTVAEAERQVATLKSGACRRHG